jgi:hypothetical protein
MATLIRIGHLILTPEQLEKALEEDMTVEEVEEMINGEE